MDAKQRRNEILERIGHRRATNIHDGESNAYAEYVLDECFTLDLMLDDAREELINLQTEMQNRAIADALLITSLQSQIATLNEDKEILYNAHRSQFKVVSSV